MQNYSFIQKILHDLVLGRKLINRSLYEMEKIIYLKDKNITNRQHVFITGLPRSGTTCLLNFIYSSNNYRSLTYKNIPFILAPNFSKIFNRNNIKKKERIHGDGIMYDIDSPDAFDEVFFKNNEKFVKNELANYIQLILSNENNVSYLSKNNLNYQRVDLITSILPNSIFLIPIREPLQHAFSLLNQHKHFSQLQNNDDFIRRYMNYLGHNEFGLNHKPWNNSINYHNLDQIDYWLEQWLIFYENIYNKYRSNENCYFVIYERLSDPSYLMMLLERTELNKNQNLDLSYFKNSNNKKIDMSYNYTIYEKAASLYKKFIDSYA